MEVTFRFGKSSSEKLATCDIRLQRIMQRALSFGIMDFSIIEGYRSIEEQQDKFKQGLSEIDGISKKGKHNYSPSLAVDIMPYPTGINGVDVWKDKQRFCVLAGIVLSSAKLEGVKIRWGGDWDGDGNNADSNFSDLPHFEILD